MADLRKIVDQAEALGFPGVSRVTVSMNGSLSIIAWLAQTSVPECACDEQDDDALAPGASS